MLSVISSQSLTLNEAEWVETSLTVGPGKRKTVNNERFLDSARNDKERAIV
jgi:hypothetical protein